MGPSTESWNLVNLLSIQSDRWQIRRHFGRWSTGTLLLHIYSHDSKAIPSEYIIGKFYGIKAVYGPVNRGFRSPCRSSIKKKIYVSGEILPYRILTVERDVEGLGYSDYISYRPIRF
jgi:hypothetical protein